MTIKPGQILKFDNGDAVVLDVRDGKVCFSYETLKARSTCSLNKVYESSVELLRNVPVAQ